MSFGRLFVTGFAGMRSFADSKAFSAWNVRCPCGKTFQVRGTALKYRKMDLCDDCWRTAYPSRLTHGMRHTPEYAAYCTAYQRCNNHKNARYYRYGARGIEFRFSNFDDFFDEVGERPDGYVLDRIDNNGHYEKGNLQWCTKSQSIRNSSKCLGGAIYKRRVKA